VKGAKRHSMAGTLLVFTGEPSGSRRRNVASLETVSPHGKRLRMKHWLRGTKRPTEIIVATFGRSAVFHLSGSNGVALD